MATGAATTPILAAIFYGYPIEPSACLAQWFSFSLSLLLANTPNISSYFLWISFRRRRVRTLRFSKMDVSPTNSRKFSLQHCSLNEYLHRINWRESPCCCCGSPSESVEHFLFFCPIFSEARKEIEDACSGAKISFPPTFRTIPKHPTIWNAMCK